MFDEINRIFDFSQKVLNLYAKRQEVLSSNIANANTPGYKPIDINFNDVLNKILKKDKNDVNLKLKITSLKHCNAQQCKNDLAINTIPKLTNQIKKDGNTVNMDQERIDFMSNSLKYAANLIFLKNEIKNIINVIKG